MPQPRDKQLRNHSKATIIQPSSKIGRLSCLGQLFDKVLPLYLYFLSFRPLTELQVVRLSLLSGRSQEKDAFFERKKRSPVDKRWYEICHPRMKHYSRKTTASIIVCNSSGGRILLIIVLVVIGANIHANVMSENLAEHWSPYWWPNYIHTTEHIPVEEANIISGTAGGRKFQKKKHIEPIEMKRLWFDVTHLFEELLLSFDWLPDRPNKLIN